MLADSRASSLASCVSRLASRVSRLASCVSRLSSHVSRLAPGVSRLASRRLASRVSRLASRRLALPTCPPPLPVHHRYRCLSSSLSFFHSPCHPPFSRSCPSFCRSPSPCSVAFSSDGGRRGGELSVFVSVSVCVFRSLCFTLILRFGCRWFVFGGERIGCPPADMCRGSTASRTTSRWARSPTAPPRSATSWRRVLQVCRVDAGSGPHTCAQSPPVPAASGATPTAELGDS